MRTMKKVVLPIFFLIALQVSAQDTTKNFFRLRQINLSINKTYAVANNATEKYGGGVGVYFFKKPVVPANLILGIELNELNSHVLFKGSGGHYGNYYENIDYNLVYLSLPIIAKIGGYPSFPVFVQMGGGFNILLYDHMSADFTTVSFITYNNMSVPDYNTEHVETSSDISAFGLEFLMGFGGEIAVKKYVCTLGFDYKYGSKEPYNYGVAHFRRFYRVSLGIQKQSY
jgi:hypothetical protein